MLVHDWPLVHRNDGLWRRWALAQCTMGSFGVVMVPPSFGNYLGFPQRVENFAVQQLVAHSPVEAFARLRDELLNGEVFFTLKEAQIIIEQWRNHYNTKRPHSALGYRPPAPESIVPMDQEPVMH